MTHPRPVPPRSRPPGLRLPALLALALPLALVPVSHVRAEPPPDRLVGDPIPPAPRARPAPDGGAPGARDPSSLCPPDLEILVARGPAERHGLATGDAIRVRPTPDHPGCPARVAGTFEPRPDPARLTADRPRVLLHLPHLARLAGREREVDRFSVTLRPGVAADPVVAALSSLLPGARVLPTREVAEASSTTFEVVRRFHRAIALITLTAGGVFLACIMILRVQERRTHVAALRLMGVSRRTLLGWLLTEAALVALVGGALGVGVGRVAVAVINRIYRTAYDTELLFALLTGETVWAASGLALALGLGAGAAAGARLLALDPLVEVGR